jgi:hypothetical protein
MLNVYTIFKVSYCNYSVRMLYGFFNFYENVCNEEKVKCLVFLRSEEKVVYILIK